MSLYACILPFRHFLALPRTESTHSTCILGSVRETWNCYSDYSAWLDWDIDETADCANPERTKTSLCLPPPTFFTAISIFYLHKCLYAHAFIPASPISIICVHLLSLCRWKTPSKSDHTASTVRGSGWMLMLLISRPTLTARSQATQTCHYLCGMAVQTFKKEKNKMYTTEIRYAATQHGKQWKGFRESTSAWFKSASVRVRQNSHLEPN